MSDNTRMQKVKMPLHALILCVISSCALAQNFTPQTDLGIGIGVDFGGIGFRYTYQTLSRIALFGAVGYNFNGIGYNVGSQIKFQAGKRIDFFLSGMYGYNAVLIVQGVNSANTNKSTYFGATIGTGIEIKPKRDKDSFFSLEILFPFRSPAYYNGMDALKLAGYDFKEAYPVLLSIGYHMIIRKQSGHK